MKSAAIRCLENVLVVGSSIAGSQAAVAPGVVGNERSVVIPATGVAGVAQDASRTVFARSTSFRVLIIAGWVKTGHGTLGQVHPRLSPLQSRWKDDPTLASSRRRPAVREGRAGDRG